MARKFTPRPACRDRGLARELEWLRRQAKEAKRLYRDGDVYSPGFYFHYAADGLLHLSIRRP